MKNICTQTIILGHNRKVHNSSANVNGETVDAPSALNNRRMVGEKKIDEDDDQQIVIIPNPTQYDFVLRW